MEFLEREMVLYYSLVISLRVFALLTYKKHILYGDNPVLIQFDSVKKYFTDFELTKVLT